MILYSRDPDILAKFWNEAQKKSNGKFIDDWTSAGGEVMEGDNLFVLTPSNDLRAIITDALSGDAVKYSLLPSEFIIEAQGELDQAREMIELQQESLEVKNKKIEQLEESRENLLHTLSERDTAVYQTSIENRKLHNDSEFRESLAKTTIAQYLELTQRQQNTIDFVVVENSKLITRNERLETRLDVARNEINELESKVRHYEKLAGEE